MALIEPAYMTAMKTILIVDDDRDVSEILQKVILEQTPYRALWIAESDLTLYAAPHFRPSLILLDYKLQSMHGLELYDNLQKVATMRGVPTILISAWRNLPYEELYKRGIAVLHKPFDIEELLDLIARLIPA